MHLWKTKSYIHLRVTSKLNQLVNSAVIIQVCKTAAHKTSFCFNTRSHLHVVIAAKVIFVEQQVHLAAS